MFRNFGWGHSIGHFFTQLVEAMIILIAVAVLAGVVFLLVRFLLVATKAAQLYVAKHESTRAEPAVTPATPAEPASPAAPAASKASTVAPSAPAASAAPASKPATASKPVTASKPETTSATKPATKPRTPKTPPSA